MNTTATIDNLPEYMTRKPLKHRRSQWDPSAKIGGIFEDKDVSTESGVRAEYRMHRITIPNFREPFVDNCLNKGFKVDKVVGQAGYRKNIRGVPSRLFRRNIQPPEECTRGCLLAGDNNIEHGLTALSCGLESTKSQKQRSGPSDLFKTRRRKRDQSKCHCLDAKNPEKSFLEEKEELPPVVITNKGPKFVNSRPSAPHAEKSSISERCLKQSSFKRYQLNSDILLDMPGQDTGKENVPPGMNECNAAKSTTRSRKTLSRRKDSTKLVYTQKSVQRRLMENTKCHPATDVVVGTASRTPKAAIAIREKNLSIRSRNGAKYEHVSSEHERCVMCNESTSAAHDTKNVNKIENHACLLLSCERLLGTCTASSTLIMPSVFSDLRPLQETGLYLTLLYHRGRNDRSTGVIVSCCGVQFRKVPQSSRKDECHQCSTSLVSSQWAEQCLDQHDHIRITSELQRLLSLIGYITRSDSSHCQHGGSHRDINYFTFLALLSSIDYHGICRKDLRAHVNRFSRISYVGTRSPSICSKISVFQAISSRNIDKRLPGVPTLARSAKQTESFIIAPELRLHRPTLCLSVRILDLLNVLTSVCLPNLILRKWPTIYAMLRALSLYSCTFTQTIRVKVETTPLKPAYSWYSRMVR